MSESKRRRLVPVAHEGSTAVFEFGDDGAPPAPSAAPPPDSQVTATPAGAASRSKQPRRPLTMVAVPPRSTPAAPARAAGAAVIPAKAAKAASQTGVAGGSSATPAAPAPPSAGSTADWEELQDDRGRPFLFNRRAGASYTIAAARKLEQRRQARHGGALAGAGSSPYPSLPIHLASEEAGMAADSDAGAGGERRLSPTFVQVDDFGCIVARNFLPGVLEEAENPSILRQMSKATRQILSPQIQQHILAASAARDPADGKAVAIAVLRCLEYFLPITGSHRSGDTATHAWTVPANTKSGPSAKAAAASPSPKEKFLSLLLQLCDAAEVCLQSDETLVALKSPTYICGDVHGNWSDLMRFAATFWRAELDLCPANLLFLGDYVDRGPHSIELTAYLLAQKILYPRKVTLLRGNHELREVNGDLDFYADTSFRHQCRTAFQHNGQGDALWESFNKVFDMLPMAATIDNDIFCCHGGLPRQIAAADSREVLASIKALKRPIENPDLVDGYVATDLLWADPTQPEEEAALQARTSGTALERIAPAQVELAAEGAAADSVDAGGEESAQTAVEATVALPPGFGPNARGEALVTFGAAAVDKFTCDTQFRFIPPDQGIRYEKQARVLTVFSSSHYCGMNNAASMVVAMDGSLKIVTTGPVQAANRHA